MNWAYVAGFFDAEGSFKWNGSKSNYLGIVMYQSSPSSFVLDRMKEFLESEGIVCYVNFADKRNKGTWSLNIANGQSVRVFMRSVGGKLILKRSQYERVCLEIGLAPLAMTKPSWAYVAGLFDGEGCLRQRNGRTFHLAIDQSSPERCGQLRFLADFLTSKGIAAINEQYDCPSQKKAMVTVNRQRSILTMLKRMRPYLHVKANQADEACAVIIDRAAKAKRGELHHISALAYERM